MEQCGQMVDMTWIICSSGLDWARFNIPLDAV